MNNLLGQFEWKGPQVIECGSVDEAKQAIAKAQYDEIEQLTKQRDELLAALERIERGCDSGWAVGIAKAAIASVKGGAA